MFIEQMKSPKKTCMGRDTQEGGSPRGCDTQGAGGYSPPPVGVVHWPTTPVARASGSSGVY